MLVQTREFATAADMIRFYGRNSKAFRDYKRPVPAKKAEPMSAAPNSVKISEKQENPIEFQCDTVGAELAPIPEPIPPEWAPSLFWFGPPEPTERPPASIWRGIHEIQLATCEVFGVPVDLISSNCNKLFCVGPRQLAMALAYRTTGKSLAAIGRQFGGRDHSTILHAVQKMKPLLDEIAAGVPPHATIREWLVVARWMLDEAAVTGL